MDIAYGADPAYGYVCMRPTSKILKLRAKFKVEQRKQSQKQWNKFKPAPGNRIGLIKTTQPVDFNEPYPSDDDLEQYQHNFAYKRNNQWCHYTQQQALRNYHLNSNYWDSFPMRTNKHL
jgi:hypothetical protein